MLVDTGQIEVYYFNFPCTFLSVFFLFCNECKVIANWSSRLRQHDRNTPNRDVPKCFFFSFVEKTGSRSCRGFAVGEKKNRAGVERIFANENSSMLVPGDLLRYRVADFGGKKLFTPGICKFFGNVLLPQRCKQFSFAQSKYWRFDRR